MKATDEAEFRQYMAARWPALLRTAYLLTGDRHHAEDLAQTALEKTAAVWGKVRSADSPDAYVCRILVNTHLSRFRKRRVIEVLGSADAELPSGLAVFPNQGTTQIKEGDRFVGYDVAGNEVGEYMRIQPGATPGG